MKNVTITSILAVGTDVSVYTWAGKSEKDVVKMERRLSNTLMKLVSASEDHAHGEDSPTVPQDKNNPQIMTYEFRVNDADGKLAFSFALKYENLPASQCAWIKGLLAGEMRDFDGTAKKEKKNR